MPLDPLGLMLIDKLLDAVVELRLLSDTWSSQDAEFLESIHEMILALHNLWQERDIVTNHDLFAFRSKSNLIHNYIHVICLDLDTLPVHSQWQKLQTMEALSVDLDNRMYHIYERNQNP